jgi:hypothetical protein
MSTTITAGNATNGLAFSPDSTGQLEIKTGTGSGTTAITVSTAQAVTLAGNLTLTGNASGIIKSGTAVTASGTSIDFTGIPSTAKRITVMFNGVSSSGTSNYLVQLGDAGGVENTGYTSRSNSSGAQVTNTTGFLVTQAIAAATDTIFGFITCCLVNSTTNMWCESGVINDVGQNACIYSAGGKSLSDVLTQVRITTVNGTDTFDAGTINILWE